MGKGGKEFVNIARTVGEQTGEDRTIVVIERTPAQGHHIAVQVHGIAIGFDGVADHRAVAGASHRVGDIGLSLDSDGGGAGFDVLPAVWGLHPLRVAWVQPLQVQVLDVWAGVGKGPCHTVGAPQHHKGQAWQGRPHDLQRGNDRAIARLTRGCLQAGKVPDRRCAQAQMGVIGQQRFAAGRARARQHPVVTALAPRVTGLGHKLARPVLPRPLGRCGRSGGFVPGGRGFVNAQRSIQPGQIPPGDGGFARIRWQQRPQLRGIQLTQQRQAGHLFAPVVA